MQEAYTTHDKMFLKALPSDMGTLKLGAVQSLGGSPT